MCVIFACVNRRPLVKDIAEAYDKNPDGAGIAWTDKKKVFWRKGLALKKLTSYAVNLPLPIVIHFRKASVGDKNPQLTHPFPLLDKVPLSIGGEAPGVLFHNGTWLSWKQICINNLGKIPSLEGQLSDSRVIAWLVHYYGEMVCRVMDGEGRICVFKPGVISRYGEWVHENGIYYSNTSWRPITTAVSSSLPSAEHPNTQANQSTYYNGTGNAAMPEHHHFITTSRTFRCKRMLMRQAQEAMIKQRNKKTEKDGKFDRKEVAMAQVCDGNGGAFKGVYEGED
jgi:hypothetical protein